MGKCCTHCKKLLHPKNKTGLCLYCYNHPPFILKKCFVCGNDFKAKRTYTRYCSNYCSVQKTPEKYQEKIKQNKWVRYDFKIDRCCSYCGAKIKHKTSRMVRTKKSFCDFSCYRLFSKKIRKMTCIQCFACKKQVCIHSSSFKHRPRKTCSKKCKAVYIRFLAEERRKKYGYTKHQLDRLSRYSPEAKEWRKKVFERDNYTCVLCNARNGQGYSVYLEADHIKPWAFFPELRFELSNGRTLCRKCHDKTKIPANKMRKIWGKH